MKVFANGFNLYGQLIEPTSLVSDFVMVFKSEVIKSFGINQSFSYIHTIDSFLLFPNSDKKVIVNIGEIVTVASNDDRIVVLYKDGMVYKLDYGDDLAMKRVPFMFNLEEFQDKILNISFGSKIGIFYSKNGKLITITSILEFKKNNIVQIECGKEHCLLLDEDGNVYSFGRGSRGQLGHGILDDEKEPVPVNALAGIKISKISAGGWHSCALSKDGDLYTWGWNSNGQLGLTNNDKDELVTVQATPHLVESIDDEINIRMMASGSRHTIILLDNNHLYGCGWNKYKQLKNDMKENFHQFTFLQDFCNEVVVELKAGPWNSAVLCK